MLHILVYFCTHGWTALGKTPKNIYLQQSVRSNTASCQGKLRCECIAGLVLRATQGHARGGAARLPTEALWAMATAVQPGSQSLAKATFLAVGAKYFWHLWRQ
mgnify:CR=1 FL=1